MGFNKSQKLSIKNALKMNNSMKNKEIILCSACLLGVNCRYNGKSKINKKVIDLSKRAILIPICPEQLGGLLTPREEAEIRNKKVITKSNKDISKYFQRGAKEVLKIAKLYKIKKAILKQKSPSCGYGNIYDGSFRGILIKGNGITADLLKKNKIKIITKEDLK